jgi:acyl carrier protein
MKHEETVEGTVSSSALLPQWYSDARVALIMRAFEDAGRHGNSQGGAHKPDSEDSSPRAVAARSRRDFEKAIRAGSADSDREEVLVLTTAAIVKTMADMLFIDAAGVITSKTVADHGIDSLISAELRNWLLLAFGSNISTLDLLDSHTNIAQLASGIVDGAVLRLQGTE